MTVHPDYGTLDDLDASDRGRGRARHRHLARPRSEPHLRPAPVVQRPARVLRLVGGDPERLDVDLHGRERLGVRGNAAALLPAPVRAGAARSRLVERRGPQRVRRHPPLLVQPRRERFPHRRGARADQGPASSGTARSTCGNGRRCTRSTAAGRRSRASTIPKPTLMGETYVPLDKLFAYYAHLDLAQNFPLPARRVRPRRVAADRRDDDEEAAERTRAGLVRVEPRPLADGDSLGRWRRAQAQGRALSAPHASGQRDPLPGRRARPRGRPRPARPHSRPGRPAARSGADAVAVDARRRRMAEPLAPADRHLTQRRGQHDPPVRPRVDRRDAGSSATATAPSRATRACGPTRAATRRAC